MPIFSEAVLVCVGTCPFHIDDGLAAHFLAHDEIGLSFEVASSKLSGQTALRFHHNNTGGRELSLDLFKRAAQRCAQPLSIHATARHQQDSTLLRHDRLEFLRQPTCQRIPMKLMRIPDMKKSVNDPMREIPVEPILIGHGKKIRRIESSRVPQDPLVGRIKKQVKA